ncbi:hypothetical protein E2C01_089200 [Portunus trituberculatus]|uniref:Uncharacterized protein n=1 Tax=Portunus trituberculatus TaxID=210409 RepID=A0A5B7JGL5_PORTR|nr:hypothetical protein [Portunus trituberculatus]
MITSYDHTIDCTSKLRKRCPRLVCGCCEMWWRKAAHGTPGPPSPFLTCSGSTHLVPSCGFIFWLSMKIS